MKCIYVPQNTTTLRAKYKVLIRTASQKVDCDDKHVGLLDSLSVGGWILRSGCVSECL